MNVNKRKVLVISSVIIVLLFFTNPSQTSFKNYLNTIGLETRPYRSHYGRTPYWGLFSMFQYQESEGNYSSKTFTYLGVFNNFISIKKVTKNNAYQIYEPTADTTEVNLIDSGSSVKEIPSFEKVMGLPEKVLSEQDRKRLDSIVSQMKANNEPEEDIHFVVQDFKNKYGLKIQPPKDYTIDADSLFEK